VALWPAGVRRTPVQWILMRTSWALGGATSTSSTDNFPPASHATAACPALVSAPSSLKDEATDLAGNCLSSSVRHDSIDNRG